MWTARDLGRNRDVKVLDGLEKHRYLRSDQIAELYFQSIKDEGQRKKKVSERMKTMFKDGLVKRSRIGASPYIYYVEGSPYSHKMLHYLAIVDVWLEIKKHKQSGAAMYYEIEKNFGEVITDLYIEMNNQFTGEKKFYFVEVELNSSGRLEEKIKKYSLLFRVRSRQNNSDDKLVVVSRKAPLHQRTEPLALNNVAFYRLNELSQWKW